MDLAYEAAYGDPYHHRSPASRQVPLFFFSDPTMKTMDHQKMPRPAGDGWFSAFVSQHKGLLSAATSAAQPPLYETHPSVPPSLSPSLDDTGAVSTPQAPPLEHSLPSPTHEGLRDEVGLTEQPGAEVSEASQATCMPFNKSAESTSDCESSAGRPRGDAESDAGGRDSPAPVSDSNSTSSTRSLVGAADNAPPSATPLSVVHSPEPPRDESDKQKTAATDTAEDVHRSEAEQLTAHINEELRGVKEEVLADVVQRLFDKIHLSSVKVVALDDLNQQLLENFKLTTAPEVAKANQPVTPDSVVPRLSASALLPMSPARLGRLSRSSTAPYLEDRSELALYLYSLRAKVQALATMLNDSEAQAHRDELRRRAREKKPRRLKVQIVRAYEEDPVPYKKSSFTPAALQVAAKPTRAPLLTSSSVYSSSSSSSVRSRRWASSYSSIHSEKQSGSQSTTYSTIENDSSFAQETVPSSRTGVSARSSTSSGFRQRASLSSSPASSRKSAASAVSSDDIFRRRREAAMRKKAMGQPKLSSRSTSSSSDSHNQHSTSINTPRSTTPTLSSSGRSRNRGFLSSTVSSAS